ncbi:hypothetical protein Tco_0530826 [Tanacetum coccineum]
MASNVNPLTLVVIAQHYPDYYTQAPKPYKTHAQSTRKTPSTKYHTTTRNKGNEIVKPLSPPSEDESDKEQARRDKNKNMDTFPRTWNDRKTRQFGNQRTSTVDVNRETIGNQEVLHVTDDNSRPTYDTEPLEKIHTDDDCNVFATKRHHSGQPETINDTYVVEKAYINVIPASSDICDNKGKAYQNAEELEDERVLLASLIAYLKLDVDENKNIQTQLKKTNTYLTQELDKYKLDLKYCKIDLESKSKYAFQDVQANVENIKSIVDTEWRQHKLAWYKPITNDIRLLFEKLLIPVAHNALKTVGIFKNSLKEEMVEDLKYVQTVEKEVDDLKMEIDYPKSELKNEKIDFLKVDDLLLQACDFPLEALNPPTHMHQIHCTCLFSLPERLKADNTIRVNWISIVTVNTVSYHSDVLARSQG